MFVYFNLYFALYIILTLCNISKVALITGVAKNRIGLSVMLESANKKNVYEPFQLRQNSNVIWTQLQCCQRQKSKYSLINFRKLKITLNSIIWGRQCKSAVCLLR